MPGDVFSHKGEVGKVTRCSPMIIVSVFLSKLHVILILLHVVLEAARIYKERVVKRGLLCSIRHFLCSLSEIFFGDATVLS